MAGHPRIAVVHGSGDHPYSVGCRDTVRRFVRQVWVDGALPIEVSQAVPCEELSLGLPGSHYAFLGRNVCAANFATLMEAHGYDAAIVIGACDKMLVGVLRALIEADLVRRRGKPDLSMLSLSRPTWVVRCISMKKSAAGLNLFETSFPIRSAVNCLISEL